MYYTLLQNNVVLCRTKKVYSIIFSLYCRAVCITRKFSEPQNPRFIIKSYDGARTVYKRYLPFMVSTQKKLKKILLKKTAFSKHFVTYKKCAENICKQRVQHLLNSYLLTILLAIPFDKLPCTELKVAYLSS